MIKQNPEERKSVVESFLRSSIEMVECLKCQQLIPFKKIDLHQIICKEYTIECVYCFDKIPSKSFNAHEIICPIKKEFDSQSKDENIQLENPQIQKPVPIETKQKISAHSQKLPSKRQNLRKVQQKVQTQIKKPLEKIIKNLSNEKPHVNEIKPQQQKLNHEQLPKYEKVKEQNENKIQPFIPQMRLNKNLQLQRDEFQLNRLNSPYRNIQSEAPMKYGSIRRKKKVQEAVYIPPEPKPKNFLTETKIGRLPTVTYQFDEANDSTICSICYLNFEENQDLVRLQDCKHLFHHECIALWLKTDSRCANCKQEVKVPPKIEKKQDDL